MLTIDDLFPEPTETDRLAAHEAAVSRLVATAQAFARELAACTRLPVVRRRYGMPRATAASTMDPVEGPRRTSSSRSRSSLSAARRSKSVPPWAAWQSWQASSNARRPTASSLYCTTT